jgi:hypothetical protein
MAGQKWFKQWQGEGVVCMSCYSFCMNWRGRTTAPFNSLPVFSGSAVLSTIHHYKSTF